VFTTAVGTPVDLDNFAHYFDRLYNKAGLGHWHPHELRHSAASIMLAQGNPLWVVSEVLGHASVPIIKDVYGHLLGGEKQAATEAITAALFGPVASGVSAS
jgi:integrase